MRFLSCCGAVLAAAFVMSCTKDNPHACAELDPCTDPERPYCDLAGNFGDPGTCIAVDCTAGETVACSGDHAVQCVPAGNNYQDVLCERGCDSASNGCRLCDPNETACTNGTIATCDASGAVVESTACPLGCFEDEPRCRAVDPSNDLAQYLDMAANAPELISANDLFVDVGSGSITAIGEGEIVIPSALLPAPAGGVRLRVFFMRALDVANLQVLAGVEDIPTPAVAFVVAGDAAIRGVLDVSITTGLQYDQYLAPGTRTSGDCLGRRGEYAREPGPETYVSGAGGGGFGAAGGHGGSVAGPGTHDGGAGGAMSGNETLEPLIGGCAGGPLYNVESGAMLLPYTGTGGGAIQVVSGTRIRLEPGAAIAANGAGGFGVTERAGGGGSGGGILLEAPVVELGSLAALTANGGSGASGADFTVNSTRWGADGMISTEPAPAIVVDDPVCDTPNLCGASGPGGALHATTTNAENISYSADDNRYASGGGGAVGRVRINTAEGSYTKASDSIESPAPSVGTVRTR